MKKRTIAQLALTGLVSGAMVAGTGCKSDGDAPSAEQPTEQQQAVTEGGEEAVAAPAAAEYSELHDCAGKNSCKGLGGCAVTAEKLGELATAAGVDAAAAGEAHDCSGKNSCKGLGGCKVDAEKLAMLKAKMAAPEGGEAAE